MKDVTYLNEKDIICKGKVLTPRTQSYSREYYCVGLEILTSDNQIIVCPYAKIIKITD